MDLTTFAHLKRLEGSASFRAVEQNLLSRLDTCTRLLTMGKQALALR